MKKTLFFLLTLFAFLNVGSTDKYEYKYQPDFALFVYEGINDSIPTIDVFGRVRNGIIAQNIIDVLNTDPSGVDLTEPEMAYVRSIVGGLYNTGMWQKSVALYGFVGGNAWKHKFNWKDLRDLDAAFRLVFVGGVTHNSNGVQFDGSTGYADTFLIPSTVLSNTSTNLYAYVKSSSTATSTITPYLMGCINSPSNGQSIGLTNRHNGTSNLKVYISSNGSSTDQAFQTTATANPFLKSYSGNYLSGVMSLWNNSQEIITTKSSNSGTDLPNMSLLIGAVNNTVFNGGPQLFDNKLLSTVIIGEGLTDSQIIRRDFIINYSQGILPR